MQSVEDEIKLEPEPVFTVLVEARDPDPTRQPNVAWKVLELPAPPEEGGLLELGGHGIPHKTRFVKVDAPRQVGEPYYAVIHVPSEHIEEHMLGEGHEWEAEKTRAA